MAEVFISYKAERRLAAKHVERILKAYGYSVWFDYALIPGDDYEPTLMRELDASGVVLVLWCRMSVNSEWVHKEARAARDRGVYLPCWIEVATLPEEFAGADTINLSTWDASPWSSNLHRLLDEVARRVGRGPDPSYETIRSLDEEWRSYGAPTLTRFPLSGESARPRTETRVELLGPPPSGLTEDIKNHWQRARAGDADALNVIGRCYSRGECGLARNDSEAVRLFKLGVDQGHARAHYNLGVMHFHGRGGLAKNEREAVRLYEIAAARDDAAAICQLAICYERGLGGLARDFGKAALLYRLAADQGDTQAQNNLGVFYGKGLGGLIKDPREALRLYKLAADQGDPAAQCNLGVMYENGEAGLTKDFTEAVRLYRLSADQGKASGQFALASMYEQGLGVARDEEKAVRLYKLAVGQGNANAMANLGYLYEKGAGNLPQDSARAAQLYRQAADKGNTVGQFNYGVCLAEGRGVPVDEVEAIRYFKLAARAGHTRAQDELSIRRESW